MLELLIIQNFSEYKKKIALNRTKSIKLKVSQNV